MTLGLFGHVKGSSQDPRCFPQRNIPSRILDTTVSQGVPCVRGFQLFHILLCHLSPQGVGLYSLACLRQSPNRSIKGKHGRHHESSRSVVDGDNRPAKRLLVRFLTVFILEQVPAGSVLEASKYQVLEAPFQSWFCNFPAPF